MFLLTVLVLLSVHRGDDGARTGSGAVYLYEPVDGFWRMHKVVPRGANTENSFGKEVVLAGDTLFVGASKGGSEGLVYVYTRNGLLWELVQVLEPEDGERAGLFGYALAYANGILVVGAPDGRRTDGNVRTGLVFTYVLTDGMWRRQETIVPEIVKKNDRFGERISFDGRHIAIGAPEDDTEGSNTGAVYVYRAEPVICQPEVPEMEEDAFDTAILLEERAELFEQLFREIALLVSDLDSEVEAFRTQEKKKEDRIIIFDESVAHESAQQRAAEVRKITGPGIPNRYYITGGVC